MLKKNTTVYTLGKLMSATTIIQKRTLFIGTRYSKLQISKANIFCKNNLKGKRN